MERNFGSDRMGAGRCSNLLIGPTRRLPAADYLEHESEEEEIRLERAAGGDIQQAAPIQSSPSSLPAKAFTLAASRSAFRPPVDLHPRKSTGRRGQGRGDQAAEFGGVSQK